MGFVSFPAVSCHSVLTLSSSCPSSSLAASLVVFETIKLCAVYVHIHCEVRAAYGLDVSTVNTVIQMNRIEEFIKTSGGRGST